MSWPLVDLGTIFDIARGGSPRPIHSYVTSEPDGINWITIGDASEGSKYITATRRRIRPAGVSKSRLVEPGDFLLTNSMSFGRPYIMKTTGCIHDGWLVLSPRGSDIDPDYFYHLLGSDEVYAEFARRAAGATVKNLNIDLVRTVRVHLPPLPHQRRIAAVLDKAEELRSMRRAAIAHLEEMTQAIFLDMFGDPQSNPNGWSKCRLGDLAERFSDGPFGSNLKTSHYTESGVRVVRLQNIGAGSFLDQDKAFISTQHFATLRKHHCHAGDVLIGTMGDPNLRACVLPDHIPVAINKADCVQMRVSELKADVMYVVTLLNHPSTLRLASSLMRGQTRVRLSMGRLRDLLVPVPPLDIQRRFGSIMTRIQALRGTQTVAIRTSDDLFASLQHRAFRGEL